MTKKSGKTRAQMTEQENPASAALDTKSPQEILRLINREDHRVAPAVGKVIPQITQAVELITPLLSTGGRLIYLGAGTSGRLGVLDAVECLPTFGTKQVVGVLAGGPRAMFRSVEGAEDDSWLAIRDLRKIKFSKNDVLVGISASGRTPYTVGGLRYARRIGAATIALTCNPDAPMNRLADVAIVPIVGPEVIAGSTRMKAGTAQKLALNMLSTACMTRLGRVFSNWMAGVQLTNKKLQGRAQIILMKAAGVSRSRSALALKQAHGKLPVALLMLLQGISRSEAAKIAGRGANIAALIRQRQVQKSKRPSVLRKTKSRRTER
ncbi:MAG TPA: N-acetylmuramic acid 6-phosphate etherase [Terriglobia bacterium]|nr:N-acetylmuramic acid 6-phosphate etherase [Terriglobia bacterium]